ncbi:MAG: O-antigen ligase family protein [Planctomycetes bacterium]|nr:O-antigen ligase family protein [Planctomycetota bacterium]
MSRREPTTRDLPPAGGADRLATVLLVLLLALAAGRTMLNEPTFHRSGMEEAGTFAGVSVDQQMVTPVKLLRAASAVAILALAAVWAAAVALRPDRRPCRAGAFGAGLVVLAACLTASALLASDRREALLAAVEQVSLLTAGWLTIQWVSTRWRQRLVFVVLVALATALGIKGVYQVFVEVPEQVAAFEADPASYLGRLAPGSPEAAMLEIRLREPTAKGFWSLANIYGSAMVLLMLPAAAMAIDKGRRALRDWQTMPRPHGRAAQVEIPLPVAAAAASTAAAVPAVAAWWLTGSIGAIASGLAAGLAAVALYVLRRPAAAHRRGLVTASAIAFVLATAGAIAFGAARGGLPMRTLQVRWEYWTGSMAMLGGRPLLGVGPGNFPDAYLPHRPLGAEEAVKNPHNVIVHVLAEYGILGGGLYLVLLAWALIALTGRGRRDGPWLAAAPDRRPWWALVAAVGAGAMAWRIGATAYPGALVLLVDNFLPALALGAGLAAAAATGRTEDEAPPPIDPSLPIAAACGVGGFALHNLSDFALFKPAAGMVFWIAAGALIAGTRRRSRPLGSAAAAAVAAGLVAATIMTAAYAVAPVWRAQRHVLDAARAYTRNDLPAAAEALRRAVAADPADANPAGDLANVYLVQAQVAPQPQPALQRAADAAAEAARRHGESVVFARQAFETTAYLYRPDLLTGAWLNPPPDPRAALDETLAKNPPNARTSARRLNALAQLAFAAGQHEQAERCYEQAERCYEQAERWMVQAVQRAGGDEPILLDHLGDIRFARGDLEQAADAWRGYRRAVEALPSEGKPSAERLERLARMNPQDPYHRLRLAELAWHLGYDDLARRELEAAVAVQDALWAGSPLRFNEQRTREVQRLRAKLETAE